MQKIYHHEKPEVWWDCGPIKNEAELGISGCYCIYVFDGWETKERECIVKRFANIPNFEETTSGPINIFQDNLRNIKSLQCACILINVFIIALLY